MVVKVQYNTKHFRFISTVPPSLSKDGESIRRIIFFPWWSEIPALGWQYWGKPWLVELGEKRKHFIPLFPTRICRERKKNLGAQSSIPRSHISFPELDKYEKYGKSSSHGFHILYAFTFIPLRHNINTLHLHPDIRILGAVGKRYTTGENKKRKEWVSSASDFITSHRGLPAAVWILTWDWKHFRGSFFLQFSRVAGTHTKPVRCKFHSEK